VSGGLAQIERALRTALLFSYSLDTKPQESKIESIEIATLA
jgi:hypothetical protein